MLYTLALASRALLLRQPQQAGGRWAAACCPCSWTALVTNSRRQLSHDQGKQKSPDDSSLVSQTEADGVYEDVPEEEFAVSPFKQHSLVPERPIEALGLVDKINKIEKKGSFTADIFTGGYDTDFLTYPEPLENRIQNAQLKKQAIMVQQLWPQIWDDPMQVQKFNFHNLFQMTVSEMMTIFEAMGASNQRCVEAHPPLNSGDAFGSAPGQQYIRVVQSTISIIIRNCLTYWPMYKSNNPHIQQLVSLKHINFGGLRDHNTLTPTFGFCWTEKGHQLGSLPPQEWQTLGKSGLPVVDNYIISGKKHRVVHDETAENFLVFYRDKQLSDQYDQDWPLEEPNPASDPFIGCALMNRSELNFSQKYSDSAGISYVDAEFDSILPSERIVFPSQRRDPTGLNIKALGQLASCSVTMGILKDALRTTYKHLSDSKRGLLDCDIIEKKLADVTSKIFAIESMVYYIAGMYDGLKPGFDAHMEATILKIVTNEYAYDILQELQQVCGSELFILSKLQDQINIYDAFLDGNIHNRLYLATMGVLWFARNKNVHLNQLRLAPWYPGYLFKTLMRERSERGDFMTLDADIYGNLHPSLRDAGTNLEYIIKRVKYATEDICMKYGKDVTAAQSSLYRLARLSMDTFILTAMCARTNKSYCNGSKNSDLDLCLTTIFADELARRVKLYIEEIQVISYTTFANKSKEINALNLKNGGYYAESPLDPNI